MSVGTYSGINTHSSRPTGFTQTARWISQRSFRCVKNDRRAARPRLQQMSSSHVSLVHKVNVKTRPPLFYCTSRFSRPRRSRSQIKCFVFYIMMHVAEVDTQTAKRGRARFKTQAEECKLCQRAASLKPSAVFQHDRCHRERRRAKQSDRLRPAERRGTGAQHATAAAPSKVRGQTLTLRLKDASACRHRGVSEARALWSVTARNKKLPFCSTPLAS